MKIGITAAGRDLESSLDPRFGRCACFLLVDPETMEYQELTNPGCTAGGGAGIQAAQAFLKSGVNILITGQCGPNAFEVLAAGGVKAYRAPVMKVGEVVGLYKKGELAEISTPGRANQGKGPR